MAATVGEASHKMEAKIYLQSHSEASCAVGAADAKVKL